MWPLSPLCIKPVQQALVQYKALRPIWPGSMHWLFMHSQKQRGWEWIKRPTFPRRHSGVLQDSTGSWCTCICSHAQPTQSACDLMTTRRVWSSAAGAHKTMRSLWEKVGMSPWGEQLRKGNALYKILGYTWKKCMTVFYPHKGYVYLISNTQRASYWVFMGAADIFTGCQTQKRKSKACLLW